jgi:hypothetical protein
MLTSRSGGSVIDSLSVIVNGIALYSDGYLDNITLTETKPSQGSGLVRRTLSISIAGESLYTSAKWTKKFYTCGVTQDSFYFSLWIISASDPNKDISKAGECLGKFVIDTGLSWNESDPSVSIALIDIPFSWEEKLNHYPQEAIDKITGTEWEGLLNSSMYYGTFTKVQMIKPASAVSTIAGLEDSTATLNSGNVTYFDDSPLEVGLGKSSFLQVNLGNNVNVVFESGEIINGTITAAGDSFKLTSLTRDTHWTTVDLEAYVANSPIDAALEIGQCKVSSLVDILAQGMYAKCPKVNFYNTAAPGNIVVTDKVIRLGRIVDRANGIMTYEDIIDPSSTVRSAIGISYTAGTTNSAFPDEPQFNHAVKDLTAGDNSLLYFRNPTTSARNPKPGDTWTIFKAGTLNTGATESAQATAAMVRAYKSTITKVYTKVGENYVLISPQYYTINNNYTYEGINNLLRVNLTIPIEEVDPLIEVPGTGTPTSTTVGGSSIYGPSNTLGGVPSLDGEIFVDITYTMKLDTFIHELVRGLYPQALKFLGYTIKEPIADCAGIITNAVISADESLLSVLDSVLYENGCTLRWRSWELDNEYRLEIDDNVNGGLKYAVWPDPADEDYAFCKPLAGKSIDNSEIVSNSFGLSVGKLDSNVNLANSTEWISVFPKVSISQNKGSGATQTIKTSRTRGKKDRYHEYDLKHAADVSGAVKFVGDALKGGHPSALCQSTRTVKLSLPLYRIDLEAADVIDLRNVDIITDSISAPIFIQDNGDVFYRYNNTNKYILVPNLFQLEQITVNLTLGTYVLECDLKQIQLAWYSNTVVSDAYNNVIPDVEDIQDPIDPGNPPAEDNPVIPPAVTECVSPSGDNPDAPLPNTGNLNNRDRCATTAENCDSPTNPSTTPSSAGLGGPCPEGGPFSPSIWYLFDKREYLIDQPGGVDISTSVTITASWGSGSVTLLPGGGDSFPFFESLAAVDRTSGAVCRNDGPGCSNLTMTGISAGVPYSGTVGEGIVTICCLTADNWQIPIAMSSTVTGVWVANTATGKVNSSIHPAVASASVKPLLKPQITLST